ncbi:MAG TPA: hypothetical protein VKT32_15370 [Chthonomonadaceae bacterium]|nr:hypothetical protein [Chthonomonadaceae bacterium]
MLRNLWAGLKAARGMRQADEPEADGPRLDGPPAPPGEANAAETLAAILELRRFRRKRGLLVWTWTLLGPLLGLGLLACLVVGLDTPIVLPGLLLFGFLLATVYRLNRQADQLEAMQAAVLTADLESCRPGPLAELLEWPHRRVRSVARLHLLRLLPALDSRDSDSLDADQRACLRHRLSVYNALTDGEFVCTALNALGVIGDTKALPYVEKLAGKGWLMWLPSARRARKAARLCLLRLEGREGGATAEEERQSRLREAQERADAEATAPAGAAENSRQEDHPQMRAAFLIAAWCIITPYLAIQAVLAFSRGEGLIGLGYGLFALLTTQLYRATLTTRHMREVRALAKTEEIGKVGALADILDWPDPYLRHLAAGALARLLPRLKASDAHLLNAQQRLSIYRMLDMAHANTYCDFLKRVLLALEQIGDVEAVPYVERLANATLTRSMREESVKKAAIECLPYLKTVAAQNQAHQTLLRASAAAETAPEALLRPIQPDAAWNQTQLLRSSASQPDSGSLS